MNRWASVMLWTLGLAGLLGGVDRWLLGPVEPEGWFSVAELKRLPETLHPTLFPRFLPESVAWPPGWVLARTHEAPGFWLGLSEQASGQPMVWIGTTSVAPPAELGRAAACLTPGQGSGCPEGWRLLTRPISDGKNAVVLTRLDTVESIRLLKGLSLRRK